MMDIETITKHTAAQANAPDVIYLLDFGSHECVWCDDPDPDGEDHQPVMYIKADQFAADLAFLRATLAWLNERVPAQIQKELREYGPQE